MNQTASRRRAGVLVPLFSIPSSRSWGVGEISDLPLLADWAREAGLSVLQLLPVNEMADGRTSSAHGGLQGRPRAEGPDTSICVRGVSARRVAQQRPACRGDASVPAGP